MTNRRCPICHGDGITHHDGELIACTCPAGLQVNLGDIAALTIDLEITLTRQSAIGADRVGGRSSETPLPFAAEAGRALAELRRMLSRWVTELAGPQRLHGPRCRSCRHVSCVQIGHDAIPRNDPPALAAWLLRQFPALAQHPFVGELTADVAKHVAAARALIDRPADRCYLGPCETVGCVELSATRKLIATSLYAAPDAVEVTCWQCKETYDVEDLRGKLLFAATDRLASASEISRALTSLGEPVTPERIRKWAERGRLVAKGLGPQHHPTYRIGDVQALLEEFDVAREGRRAG